jgi:uncharacterized membrane protein YkoI
MIGAGRPKPVRGTQMQLNCRCLLPYIAVFGILLGHCLASEKTIKPEELPKKVTDALHARFPGLKIDSAAEENDGGKTVYDIELKLKGRKVETDIRADGTMLEVEKQLTEKEWPAVLKSAMKSNHPKATIREVMEVFKVHGKEEVADHYELTVQGADKKAAEVLISLDGKPFKEEAASPSAESSTEEDVKFDELPKAVKDALRAKFPKAEVGSAEKGKEDGQTIFEITVKDKGHSIDVTTTTDGKILSYEKTLPPADQPKMILRTLKSKYPNSTIKLAEEVWEHDKLVGYEFTIATADKKTVEVTFDPKCQLKEAQGEK